MSKQEQETLNEQPKQKTKKKKKNVATLVTLLGFSASCLAVGMIYTKKELDKIEKDRI